MQVLFCCIVKNPQVSACKACKMVCPFRDIPQLVPENLGNSKESIHLRQLFLLGFHAGMGIKLECQSNFRVPQDFRECADVHTGFDGSGCERVPQRMDAHLRQACLLQGAMEGSPQIAAFVWGSKVRTENQIISIPCWPLGYLQAACLRQWGISLMPLLLIIWTALTRKMYMMRSPLTMTMSITDLWVSSHL